MMHLQISDVLQEFLAVADQKKLVEFDRKKLEQIRRFGEKRIELADFAKNFETIVDIALECDSGCPRYDLN